MTPILVFDIETIPDAEGLRKTWALDPGVSDQAVIDLAQRDFSDAGIVGRRRDRQRHDRRPGADRGADDQPCHRDQRHQKDDEGHRTEAVDDGAERAVHP